MITGVILRKTISYAVPVVVNYTKGGSIMELVDAKGNRLRPKNKGDSLMANKAMQDLVARVQNLEAVMIMVATLAQQDMTPACSEELDIVMEAFYKAQTKRGATHLAREPTDDDPAIFI